MKNSIDLRRHKKHDSVFSICDKDIDLNSEDRNNDNRDKKKTQALYSFRSKGVSLKLNHTLIMLAATTIVLSVLFYMLNYWVPLYADDYTYSFSFADETRVTNVSQILDSMRAHYVSMNGRIVTHALAQVFLLLGDSKFNFINTICFILLLYIISFHATGSFLRITPLSIALAFMFLLLSCPAFGQSFLWITGAANYLYSSLMVLLYLVPYRLYVEKQQKRISKLFGLLFAVVSFIFGIFAGWSNENMSVALICMISAFVVFFVWQGLPICIWHVTGIIGAVTGSALMIFAPATMNRLERAGGSGNFISWCKRFIYDLVDLFINFRYVLIGLCLLYCIWVFYSLTEKKEFEQNGLLQSLRKLQGKQYSIIIVYVIGCIVSVFSMIVSPVFPGRVWSGPIILAVIVFLHIEQWTAACWKRIPHARIVCYFVVLSISFSVYFNAYLSCRRIHHAFNARENMIAEQLAMGMKIVKIPSISGDYIYSCYRGSGDLSENCDDWPNTAIAKYYGVEKIMRNGLELP